MIFQNPRAALNPIRKVGRQIEDVLHQHAQAGSDDITEKAIGILEQVPVSPSTLSHHLKRMQASGVIDRAEGKERGYRILQPKTVARLMATYELATADQIDTFLRVWGEFRV